MRIPIAIALATAAAALPGGAGAATACPSRSMDGTAGPDHIQGTAAGETMRGLGGDDLLEGVRGGDCIYGGDGDDRLEGGFGIDRLFGGAGADLIGGNQERSEIHAWAGPDRVSSSNGVRDLVDCGTGSDRVVADRADDLRSCESVRYATSPYPLVTPARGTRGTTFVVYFRALYPAGPGRGQYVIGAVGPKGCSGVSSFGRISQADIRPGQIVRFRLPAWPKGGWCPGLWHGVGHWEESSHGGRDIRLGRYSFRVAAQ